MTDAKVEQALVDAAERGVRIRIVLEPRQRNNLDRLGPLAASVRYSRDVAPFHLKSYAIDRSMLRTGSANFTRSGEHDQQNDLIVIRDPQLAAKFEAHFQRMWTGAAP
jgi:phosphatidylserine/phosphatidylglycerophosphate/cardiolipin synthase-like enzyme